MSDSKAALTASFDHIKSIDSMVVLFLDIHMRLTKPIIFSSTISTISIGSMPFALRLYAIEQVFSESSRIEVNEMEHIIYGALFYDS